MPARACVCVCVRAMTDNQYSWLYERLVWISLFLSADIQTTVDDIIRGGSNGWRDREREREREKERVREREKERVRERERERERVRERERERKRESRDRRN